MSSTKAVFFDPDKKRWPRIRLSVVIVISVISLILGLLAFSIISAPVLSSLQLGQAAQIFGKGNHPVRQGADNRSDRRRHARPRWLQGRRARQRRPRAAARRVVPRARDPARPRDRGGGARARGRQHRLIPALRERIGRAHV